MIATELGSERNRSNFPQALYDVELPYECDYCGRAVHRETATVHTERTDEVVVLCPECESGSDA
jgi:hypothetical protein